MKDPIKVVVTGAAGRIANNILPRICHGDAFGSNQPVILSLLDITPALPVLKGIVMELEDCCFPLITSIETSDDPKVALKDADFALMLASYPFRPGMERVDLLIKNKAIFKQQGIALDTVAKKTVKVLVVGNPANTNCLVLSEHAPSIPKENFCALTRLDHNRAVSLLAARAGCTVRDIDGPVCIFGNHSSTMAVYAHSATVKGKKIQDVVEKDFFSREFEPLVQVRGGAIIKAKGTPSVFSAAAAIIDCIHDWMVGSEGRIVSMAVASSGKYGIPEGVFFSVPCKCEDGKYEVVDLDIDPSYKEEFEAKLQKSYQELISEAKLAEIY
ncbi:Malate dehydrogenase [Aduncisulcus paluster]|uniref:Malate dehydrogenase n=1 Tax=Aduncisulcus paluster TaxID=2918883 RepID=A0ABQ5K709_9EUKA|nr:Malate dehydrogenase [Aduncisulcus paluster]